MANLSNPTRQITLTKFGGQFTEADARDLPEGASPLCHDCDFDVAGVGIRPGLSTPVAFRPAATGLGFYTLKSVYLKSAIIATITQDSESGLWWENLNSPGTFNRFYNADLAGTRGLVENVGDSAFMCFSDLTSGLAQPKQFDGTNVDRISQVGPGAGPVVAAPTQQQSGSYPITSITEAWPQHSIYRSAWGANPDPTGSQTGNIITLFAIPGDNTFTANLNVGDIVYISGLPLMGTGLPSGEGLNPNGTYTVASVGLWNDGSGTLQIFQVIASNNNAVLGDYSMSGVGFYQKTEAIIQTSAAVPPSQAGVGSTITVAGSSVPSWNAQWTIKATPTEGQLLISSTSLTSNVATYDYSLVSGNAPGWQPNTLVEIGTQIVDGSGNVYQVTTPGTTGATEPTFGASSVTDNTVTWTKQTGVQVLATVFNTNNGEGIFNIQNLPITSATPTSFTVAITSPNIGTSAEEGQAFTGAGTVFVIDPGTLTLNTGNPGTNPVYGNATGGYVLTQSTEVTPGQRYAILLFLTRNGFITPASPPVSFYTTGSTASLTFTSLAIGPANVIARIVAITAANAGIGGPYYWIPEDNIVPASAQTFGLTITYNKTIVDDNTSTSLGPITLSDTVLLSSNNVTEDGNNRLQIRELGECVKAVAYAGRVAYLGERTKVDNFVNLTFDGGYITGSFPAGWTLESGTAPSLITSLVFGQSASFGSSSGAIQQTAYEDVFQVGIIQPNTAYSVRVTAYTNGSPSSLTISLIDGSNVYSFSPSLTSSFAEYIGAFSNPLWLPVPSDLLLRVTGQNCIVDRIEIFPTEQPVYASQIAVSYEEDGESIDAETGILDIAEFTSEPATNIYQFLDVFYIATGSKVFSVPANLAGEPSTWNIREVSNASGCFGPMCDDVGEEYVLTASLKGVYVFDGGNHIKLSQGIQQLWDSIYWDSGKTIWIKNDIDQQRVFVGIPIPTPNVWIPNAPTNATPALPNWIEAMSYLGVINGKEMGEEVDVHPSMFTGNLLWIDMRRKWNPWQIPSPYGAWVKRADGSEQFWLGGIPNSALIYKLDPSATSDDGAAIPEFYMTYSFSDKQTEEQLGLGSVRKLYNYASVLIEGSGSFYMDVYPETPATPYVDMQPAFILADPALDDTNVPLNTPGNRVFLAFRVDGSVGSAFSLKRIVLGAQPHPHIPVSGR